MHCTKTKRKLLGHLSSSAERLAHSSHQAAASRQLHHSGSLLLL